MRKTYRTYYKNSTGISEAQQFIRDSLGVMQRHISVMEEKFGEKLERIMSELEKMTLTVKQPSKKHSLDH
jgi:hypothetical protein